jgi:hypothetical protein
MISFISTGCASKSVADPEPTKQNNQAKVEEDLEEGTQTETEDGKNNSDDSTQEISCRSAKDSSTLKKYTLDLNGGSGSLCDHMESGSYDTLVVMITSPTCLSCKPVMKEINQYIKNNNKIDFVVAVPNQHVDVDAYTMNDVQTMIDESAQGATPAFDPNGEMWLNLSEDSQNPVFPLVLVVNKSAKGKLIQTATLEQSGTVTNVVIPAIDQYSN